MSRIAHAGLRSKICTADEAASLIKNGMNVGFSGFTGAGYPKAVPVALAAQIKAAHERGEEFMIGCFTGGIVLSKISNRVGILVCGTIMTASTVCFAIFCSITSNPPVALFWVAVALVGFGNSNVFSLFLSHALMYRPERQNEISGLMLMGLIGGAIFPPIMGALADAMSAQLGAIIVMSVGCIYVLVIGVGYKAIIEGKKAAVKA